MRLRAPRQPFAESPVSFEVPFTAHRLAAAGKPLDMEEGPDPASCRFGTCASVVFGEALVEVDGPSDIGANAASAGAAEDVDEAFHLVVCVASADPCAY